MEYDFDAGDLRIDYDAARVDPAQLEQQLERSGFQLRAEPSSKSFTYPG